MKINLQIIYRHIQTNNVSKYEIFGIPLLKIKYKNNKKKYIYLVLYHY